MRWTVSARKNLTPVFRIFYPRDPYCMFLSLPVRDCHYFVRIRIWIRIRILPSISKKSKIKKYRTVLRLLFDSMKTDVNIHLKSN
jgi:hypothetical protein